MSQNSSPTDHMRYFQQYLRQPKDQLNNLPRKQGDFRERVPRQTIKGRYAFFHQSIEMYLDRQWRAYTVPRVGLFWLMSFGLFWNSIGAVAGTFYNVEKLGFRTHPNYKMLGPGWSHFYLLRPIFCNYFVFVVVLQAVIGGYVTFRMTRWLYNRIKLHWLGFDQDHYFWWYDTAYPDFIYSKEDDRYLNYRYYDTPITPQTHTQFLKPEYESARRFQKMSRTPQTFLFNLNPHSKFLNR